MNTLTKISTVALIALSTISCNKNSKTQIPLADLRDSASYVIGIDFGQSIAQFSRALPDSVNLEALIAGLRDAAQNADTPRFSFEEMQRVVEEYQMAQVRLKFKQEIEDGEKFLAENAKREGVQTTASGLQYEVITMGAGAKPGLYDTVTVHYHGTKLDGTVFDSSKGADAVAFPANGVIPGFSEGLQLFPAGSKFKLFIPEHLAYGIQGSRSGIKPFETLIFEVELISFKKGEAPKTPQFDLNQLMQQQGY